MLQSEHRAITQNTSDTEWKKTTKHWLSRRSTMKLNDESTLGEKLQPSILQLQERTGQSSTVRFYGAEWAELEEIPRICLFIILPIQWIVINSWTTQGEKKNHGFFFFLILFQNSNKWSEKNFMRSCSQPLELIPSYSGAFTSRATLPLCKWILTWAELLHTNQQTQKSEWVV